ncbi:class I SAM-dependent methyltransferase [Synechococcus sp. A10-1-5-1]|uniref:class I SAM-dependent methyltransferase n=1 Tax=Synechococcus sp. A10-1-5-1 TaxID=2936507 RepID=UPI002001BC51|nr:class I SAM-dependent methyltransferase [Synechococcus sp. A10-1-5-1]UPM50311.1 class I SAM-dependent methyltransferase [Synechococcus sp. A10-1-5-1]
MHPSGYDRLQSQVIPGYGSLARLAVALLSSSPAAQVSGSSILVAGCGTGAELLEAIAQRPDWNLTALDPSEEMLTASRQRLGEAPSISWHQATVEGFVAGGEAAGGYAGALSVLVLQSLPDDGSKLAYLSALAKCLQPGAQLVLVDLMRSSLTSLEPQLDAAWDRFQRASGLDVTRELLPSEGLHPIGLARLTSLVNAAGFGDPARVFQALGFEGFLLQRQG